MTNNFQDLFSEFAGEVQERLPWAQIINAPNLSVKQLESIKPPHGLFLTDENIELAGINREYVTRELGWDVHEQAFQDGKEVVTGLITNNMRFCCLHTTPVVVEAGGQIVGFLFSNNMNLNNDGTLSEIGQAAIADPLAYRKKSWWLIALLDKNNLPLSDAPIKLCLGSATGAAFKQELAKSNDEFEIAFFKQCGQPRKSLSTKARASFVHDWTLTPYKAFNKAPYEFPGSRLAMVAEPTEVVRYSNGGNNRTIKLLPSDFLNHVIRPSSDIGQILDKWHVNYEEAFYRKINYFKSNMHGNKVIEPVAELGSLGDLNDSPEDAVSAGIDW